MRSISPALPDSRVSTVEKPDTSRRFAGSAVGRVVAIKRILVERYRREGYAMSLIREAIATAEAEAWLSGFPHLFLPDLADEILRHLSQSRTSEHPEFAQAA
jgi:hypothetical protein